MASLKVRKLIRTSSGSDSDSTSSKSTKLESLFRRKSSLSKDKETPAAPSSPQSTVSSPTVPRTSSGSQQTGISKSPARIPANAADSDSPVRGHSNSAYSLFHSNTVKASNPTPKPIVSLFSSSGTFSKTTGSNWNTPQPLDADKRATAFPSRLFISMKPLEIVNDTAGAGTTKGLFNDVDEEFSFSRSNTGSAGGAGTAGGGSVSQERNLGTSRKTTTTTRFRVNVTESGSIADKADVEETASIRTTSQADFEEDMKTIAGDVESLLDEAGAGAGEDSISRNDSSETINGICKHFLRGKCRFREKCRNSHAIDNCVHCNAKLPKSRLAASAHLSKCYKSKYGGVSTVTPSKQSNNFDRSEAATSTGQDDVEDEVSLFEALSLK